MLRKVSDQTVEIGCQDSPALAAVDSLGARIESGQRFVLMIVHAFQKTSIIAVGKCG
jgi:hypothetical protein